MPNPLALGSFPSEGMTPFSFESSGCSRLHRSPSQHSSALPQMKWWEAAWLRRWLQHSYQGSINSSSHWMHQLFFTKKQGQFGEGTLPFKSKSLCSFHLKFSHFWSPKSGHLLPQTLRTQALGKSKIWVFSWRESVNWDSPAVGSGLAQENISSHHRKTQLSCYICLQQQWQKSFWIQLC